MASWHLYGTGAPSGPLDVWLIDSEAVATHITTGSDWCLIVETSAPFTGYDMAESGRIEVASISGEIPFADHPPVRARHRLYRGADMADMTEAHLLAVRSPQEATGVLNIAGPYPWQAEDRRQLRHDPATLITQRIPEVATGFGRLGWALPMSIDRVYVSARASAVLGYRPRHGVTALLTEVHTSG